MATRARLGYVLSDDSIVSVYHHWDGYPEWLGVTLNEQYNTDEKVRELIDGGNMSSCWSDSDFDYDKQGEHEFLEEAENYWGDMFGEVIDEVQDYMKCDFKKSHV